MNHFLLIKGSAHDYGARPTFVDPLALHSYPPPNHPLWPPQTNPTQIYIHFIMSIVAGIKQLCI